jgi:hypothetical protein
VYTLPALSVDDAYEIAACVLSLPHCLPEYRNEDFPDPDFRPVDQPVSKYFSNSRKALEKAESGPLTNE